METPPMPGYIVGLTYNLKKGIQSEIEDLEAEYDSIDTVLAIKNALEQSNCKVELLEADADLFRKLQETKVDLVFNFAEGIYGRGREAQVPAILNFLKIPFTGSDETTLSIALDKALCKRILATYKIKTPKFQHFYSGATKINHQLKFPLIIKPNAEGSSKGISDCAVVENAEQLKSIIEKNIKTYQQSFLAEEYIAGREFTVALAGNGEETTVFPPMEIIYKDKENKYNIYSYNVKKDYTKYVEYSCPAQLAKTTEGKIIQAAKKIYTTLECKDFARIDFRLSEQEEVFFIEINPLPGLAPGYSDYPMIAQLCGIQYRDMIKRVLNSALKRYGMAEV